MPLSLGVLKAVRVATSLWQSPLSILLVVCCLCPPTAGGLAPACLHCFSGASSRWPLCCLLSSDTRCGRLLRDATPWDVNSVVIARKENHHHDGQLQCLIEHAGSNMCVRDFGVGCGESALTELQFSATPFSVFPRDFDEDLANWFAKHMRLLDGHETNLRLCTFAPLFPAHCYAEQVLERCQWRRSCKQLSLHALAASRSVRLTSTVWMFSIPLVRVYQITLTLCCSWVSASKTVRHVPCVFLHRTS